MINDATMHEHANGDNLSLFPTFSDIKCDEESPCNNVHCSTAADNFRAGESVELKQSVHIFRHDHGGNYSSHVGAILKVNQQSHPQQVLLSLFLDVSDDMGISLQAPDYRNYILYPSQHVVWTRFQGWFPVTLIQREAFVVVPWAVNAGNNDAHLCHGMTNAYCIVAKWNNSARVPNPRRAFESLGHDKIDIPGCLHLIDFDCVSMRYWTFRSTVAVKVADILSRPSLTTRTQETINLDGVSKAHWENFKKCTVPLEETRRDGVVTKRAIRKNLAVEMLRDVNMKHFVRFDTLPRFALLKGYFGNAIKGAARLRRFAGPKFSPRTGPAPAYLVRRITNGQSVGALIGFPEEQTPGYHSNQPGIDLIYNPGKRQFTIRIRYRIRAVGDPLVRQELLGLPTAPPPALPNIADPEAVILVPNMTEFEHNGTLFIVRSLMVDSDEVVCEVLETDDDDLSMEDQINLPLEIVKDAVTEYNRIDIVG
jgi:hypothetical protein